MARFGKKNSTTDLEQIADLIIAEWFRVVPDGPGDILEMDTNALTAALNNILDVPCQAVPDKEDLVHVVIPYPPRKTRAELEEYLDQNGQFRTKMTDATIFGCGR